MPATLTAKRGPSLGYKARRLRLSLNLTRRELAERAGVPPEQVDLFEHDLPLPLNSKRKILKELWAIKVKK